jgi:hypothetical protein
MNRFLIALVAILLISCSDQGLTPKDRDFNIMLRFGVGGRNELNTFENTYTKDLILDGTITVSLVLSDIELDSIEYKLVQSGFFTYPDTFVVNAKDSLFVSLDPHPSYFFRVKHQSTVKTLYWDDSIVPFITDIRRKNLQDIVAFISNIVGRKPEFLNLPPARGGYL